jgi:hypothetical protein
MYVAANSCYLKEEISHLASLRWAKCLFRRQENLRVVFFEVNREHDGETSKLLIRRPTRPPVRTPSAHRHRGIASIADEPAHGDRQIGRRHDVSRPQSSRARTSIRLSSRLLINTKPIGPAAFKPHDQEKTDIPTLLSADILALRLQQMLQPS